MYNEYLLDKLIAYIIEVSNLNKYYYILAIYIKL